MKLLPSIAAALLVSLAFAAPPEYSLSVSDLAAPSDAFVPATSAPGLTSQPPGGTFRRKDLDAWELHWHRHRRSARRPRDHRPRIAPPRRGRLDLVGQYRGPSRDHCGWRPLREPGVLGRPERGLHVPSRGGQRPYLRRYRGHPFIRTRVYRLAYDASRRALEAEFDLGLTPETTAFPSRADFHLLVYPHDPQWGFRDAVERYYRLFPEYAVRRAGPAALGPRPRGRRDGLPVGLGYALR